MLLGKVINSKYKVITGPTTSEPFFNKYLQPISTIMFTRFKDETVASRLLTLITLVGL